MGKPTQVVGRRVAAFLIDGIVLYAFSFFVFFLMAEKESDIGRDVLRGDVPINETLYINLQLGDEEYSIVGSGKFFLYLLIILAAGFLYLAVLQGIKGWTPGKLALGIRTVDAQGNVPGIGRATGRWALWVVDGIAFYLVAFITALATERNQRVGDLVAKTFVVNQTAAGRPPFAPASAGAGGYGQGDPGGYGQPQPGYGQQPQQPQQPAQQAEGAGWHPDPHGQARLRYWDGSQWTEHTSQ